ncbi:MAG: FHA domain-containing protein [Candidatus Promineifilaceae bacterium]|nr:FHA domain-containing protein [Candidatus Promineifilaceae bacterium]
MTRQQLGKYGLAVTLLLMIACFTAAVYGQNENRLEIAAVDTSEFPVVRVTLVTADSRSAPADLTNLTISENGIPVTDFMLDSVAAGMDAIFVIDANTGFDEVDDDSGLTRREKIYESIQRFTSQYMNPEGLDRISIVIPSDGGQSGDLLIQQEGDPQKVLAAIDAYEPARLGPTPLNAMLNLALEQAQQSADGSRYQALLLFSDARRMDEQLSYPLLVAQANDADVAIYGAILGQSADEEEQNNMARLAETTRAFHVHMPQSSATDVIYEIWQQQSNPTQVVYRSRQRQSGRSQVSINLGDSLVSIDFELALASPTIDLNLPVSVIRRVGTRQDAPLDSLQPQFQPVSMTVSWPDGFPRKIIELVLLANNIPQPISDSWQEGSNTQIDFVWDISNVGDGPVELVVQALDELGYQGSSMPQTIEIMEERPLPQTAVPTSIPQEPTADTVGGVNASRFLYAAVGAGMLMVVIILIWLWRLRVTKKRSLNAGTHISTTGTQLEEQANEPPLTAVLESLSPEDDRVIILDQRSITFGSDARSADIVLNDVSISRLHARVRRQENTFWLFDEGSTEGVFLNFERLGLAPRELHEGDTVQLGKLTFRFTLIRNRVDEVG